MKKKALNLIVVSKIYRYINILSIDVVLGACINSWMISKLLYLEIPLASIFGLAACVWLIYTADHLIDASHLKHKASTGRHFFHQKFFYSIFYCFLIILILGLINIWFLPRSTQFWGGIISISIFLYLLFIAGLKIKIAYFKEIIIAAIYAISIFMVPVSIYAGSLHPPLILAFLQLFLLAFLNLMVFSLIEISADRSDGHKSLVRLMGADLSKNLIKVVLIILLLSFFFASLFFGSNPVFQYAEIIYFAMAIVLFFIYWKRSALARSERYRLLGDLVFLFPLLLIFFI